jgi:protein-disulfide isomerase
VSSRQEQKAAARAAREQAEREAAAATARRKRLGLLGGILAIAAIVAIVVAVTTGGGGDNSSVPSGGKAAPGGAEAYQLLGGIPEHGFTLGQEDAPLTLIEFNDMQCPICRQYQEDVFPTLVKEYVRPGKLRMEMRLQSFIGPDSVKAGKAVAAAAQQNKAWIFSEIFYANQGTENTGYVTDDFLRSIGSATPGLNTRLLLSDMDQPAAAAALKKGDREFQQAGFTGTPSFLVGKTGGPLSPL